MSVRFVGFLNRAAQVRILPGALSSAELGWQISVDERCVKHRSPLSQRVRRFESAGAADPAQSTDILTRANAQAPAVRAGLDR